VMGRKLLADPDLPNKLAAGRVDDVRPCIYQYRCIGNIFVKGQTHCVGNATTGREHDMAALRTVTAKPQRVLVIGGGPGGLETARVLSARGHDVTLWEAAERLGGMLRFAAPVDPLLDQYAGWLARQVEQQGVTIEVGRRANAANVAAFGADHVVVAVGAHWGRPDLPGADLAHVRTIPDLTSWLQGDEAGIGPRVVVIGGGKPGITLSTALRARGHDVTVLESTHVFCAELGLPGRWRLVADAEAAGVMLVGLAAVESINADGVVAAVAGGPAQTFAADSVVIAGGARPNGALAAELGAAGITTHGVGDCVDVRRIEGANLDAAALALSLG
jgi:2,4-dienoyl-CoA reductase (NADPH2)